MKIERKTIKRINDINKGDILTVLDRKDLMKMTKHPDYGRNFSNVVKVFMPLIAPGMVMLCGKKISVNSIHYNESIIRVRDTENGELNPFNWSIKYFKEYSP